MSSFDPRQEPPQPDPAPTHDASKLSIPYSSGQGHHSTGVGYQIEGNHEKARITMWAGDYAITILELQDDEIREFRDRLTEVLER